MNIETIGKVLIYNIEGKRYFQGAGKTFMSVTAAGGAAVRRGYEKEDKDQDNCTFYVFNVSFFRMR